MRRQCSAKSTAVALCLPFVLATPALAGPDWTEVGDAGSGFGNAQVPIPPDGTTQLLGIHGQLGGARAIDLEDMYFIRVVTPATFSITTGASNFNPVLYLFQIGTFTGDALGLLANDDGSSETNTPLITQSATDGSGAILVLPGDYLLGIAGFGRVPVSVGGAIFQFDSPTEISGPDGPGGSFPLSGWVGDGETGSYNVAMEDIGFPNVPAPGGLALPAIACMWGTRRRR